MIEKCQLAATEISGMDVLNRTTVLNAVSQMGGIRATRMIVTDQNGMAIYDSATPSDVGKYILFHFHLP